MDYQNSPETNINMNCNCLTLKNKKCKNKATENGKCTYHNNRINNIINSGICKKLVFENCEGFDYEKLENINQADLANENKHILKKCNDIGVTNINNKYYCEKHKNIYKFEKPDECVICSENILYDQEIPLRCGHWFHLNCLKKCNKMQCPMCRKYYESKELQLVFDLVTIIFTEVSDAGESYSLENNNILFIPSKIVDSEIFGIYYIEFMYREIVMMYNGLDLQYTSKIINKVLLNIFKNNEYLNVSLKVFNMFDRVIENGIVKSYIVKESINFDEDNEYTLNYDRFQEVIENLYHSV